MNTQTNSTEANAVGNHPGGDRPAAPLPPPPASGSRFFRAVMTGTQLADMLELMRRVHGEKWPAIVADHRPGIEALMKKENTASPYTAVLPVAKRMQAEGVSPMMLFAIATQMILDDENTELTSGHE